MKPSKFQFLNPYLEEVYFAANADFQSDVETNQIEMQNVFHINVKRSKDANRANVELILESNLDNEEAPFKLRIKVASDFNIIRQEFSFLCRWEMNCKKNIKNTCSARGNMV